MPSTLLYLFAPLALWLSFLALAATSSASRGGGPSRLARRLLLAFVVLACLHVAACATDAVHLLWSIQYPLLGLFCGVGFALTAVWARDRLVEPSGFAGCNGAHVALVSFGVLGVLPLVASSVHGPGWLGGRLEGSPLPALGEVFRYGFGGPVPELMKPMHPDQIARGLGSPPRWVTVPMASTFLAAVATIAFAGLAFAARLVPSARRRRIALLVLPLAAALVAFHWTARRDGLEGALWHNDPWLVRAYGPTLTLAVLFALALLIAVHLEGRSAPATDPSPSNGALPGGARGAISPAPSSCA